MVWSGLHPKIERGLLTYTYNLQDFQYGSNVLQTTTTDMNALNNPLIEDDGCLRFIL